MTAPQTRGPRPGEFGIATYPHAGHPVNPRRPRAGRINADDVAHGYAAGRNHRPDPPQPPQAGGHWDDGGRRGCPLTALILLPLLPLLPLFLALAWWRRRADPPADWPPPHSRRKTPAPRRDLSAAAEHYAREARKARNRVDGFSLGDPVRKRNGKDKR